jgi:DNA-binding transcriptional MerR regulator
MAVLVGKPKRKRIRDGVELIKMAELSKRSAVSAPTLKHFMREGLLPEPVLRTSRNMSYYDARLVDRIAVIRQLQAERFLPLKVIADLLEPAPSAQIKADVDRNSRSVMSALAPVVSEMNADDNRWKITAVDLAVLEGHALIEPVKTGEGIIYSGLDYRLLEALRTIKTMGLEEVFPATLIEPYMQLVKQLVAAEIAIFRGRVLEAGASVPMPIAGVAQHAVTIGGQVLVVLRSKLLPALLSQQIK